MPSLRVPSPRLLPVTIAAMATLLAMKSLALVQAANASGERPGMSAPVVAPAQAASPEPATPRDQARPDQARPEQARPDRARPEQPRSGVTRLAQGDTPHAQPAAGRAAPDRADPSGGARAGKEGTAPGVAGGEALAGGPPPSDASSEPPVADGERVLLLELRARRVQLDAREQTVSEREGVLAAAERRLAARVQELTNLQSRLEALEAARRERDDANWRSMVKLYETMKPRDAATILNDLDMAVLLQILNHMKEAKAAPILAAMQPERARQATSQLAQMRTRANTVSGS